MENQMVNTFLYREAAQSALKKFQENAYHYGVSENDIPHVVNIAASIMLQRDCKVRGGGFANAVVENDLEAAVNLGDSVCRQHLAFFVHCKRFIHPAGR